MMDKVERPTTRGRIAWAVIVMIVLPTVLVTEALAFVDPQDLLSDAITWRHGKSLEMSTVMLPFVVVLAWPYLLSGSVAWVALHRLRWASPPLAAIIGLAEGLACAHWGTALVFKAPAAVVSLLSAIFAVAGAMTGLVVWQVAYGRYGKFARPVETAS